MLCRSVKRRVSPEDSLKQTIVSQSGERGEDLRRDVVLVDRRVVVDHHRQVGRARHRAEVRGRLVRLRRVDERRHQHHAVEPMRAASFAMSIAKADVNSAMPHSTGHAAARHGFRRLHDGNLLGFGERAVLADGAADDEPGYAVADQPFHDARGGVDVERKIGTELRRDGGEDAFPGYALAHRSPPAMFTG
jgi:hypothetical protein